MVHLTERNGIFIAELIIYIPAVLLTILLCIRHGFLTGMDGFRPLLMFVLARLVGSILEIALITNPTNISLYIGSFVVLTIAISPLQWTALALLNRVLTAVNKAHYQQTWIKARYLGLTGLLILVGLILSIVGGVKSGQEYSSTGVYRADEFVKASIIIWLATFVIIIGIAFFLCAYVSSLNTTEKRVLLAVVISLPLLLVRLVYSAIGIFSGKQEFNTVTGNVNLLLGMALVEEIVIVYLYIGVGLTLKRKEKEVKTGQEAQPQSGRRDFEMMNKA